MIDNKARRQFLYAGAALTVPALSVARPKNPDAYAFEPAPRPALPIVGSRLRFPVRRIFCVGLNYSAHRHEMGDSDRDPPFFFSKQPDMIVPSGTPIQYPSLTQNFHHEIELVVAMKAGGQNIPVTQALALVYGYGVGLDMTRRDLQTVDKDKRWPWESGKSFEQSAPCSAISPVTTVGHLTSGRIHLTVNGQTRQDADLKDMIWNAAEVISHLSSQFGLAAGDVIYTGTPDGVGPVSRGDEMRAQIDGLEPLVTAVA